MRFKSFFVLALVFAFSSVQAADKKLEICIYKDAKGNFAQVISRANVPPDRRHQARCFESKTNSSYLAKPDEMEIKGTARKVQMSSSVGRIRLKWPRKVELLFGRSPERAMAAAARTASRALKQGGFDPELRTIFLDWNVVFLDADLPETQIPAYLIRNCHPAWMTPPANMYFIAQRITGGCQSGRKMSTRVADAKLEQVMLHEIGHVLEYHLLKGSRFSRDKMRAEGFATWFEQYASNYSAAISKGKVEEEHQRRAKIAIKQRPNAFHFSGSALDYSRASMYFKAVENKKGVYGLMSVYGKMRKDGMDFQSALKKTMGWTDKKLNEEMKKAATR